MSEPNSQGEPTMEEILASIRKIISEDGPDAEAAGEAEAEGEAAEAVAAPVARPEAAKPVEEAARAPQAEAAEEDEDVLDLTQEVKEDGTVVDLKAKRDGAAEAAPVAEPEPEPEPEQPADLELSDDAPAEESPLVDEPEPEIIAPEPEAPEPVMPEPALPETEMAEPEPQPEPVMAAAAAAAAIEGSGLLADRTRDAATASLVELAVTAGLGTGVERNGSGASGQTLEMLVREALRPYLKSWLDENLAPLVERIVREEIQKMVKRAEYR